MPSARQMTTAELEKLIQINIEKSLKVPRGSSEYDKLKRAHDELIRQKDRAIRDLNNRVDREVSNSEDWKRQAEKNFNDGESNRDRSLEDRRNGTAGDAQKEIDRRRARASKNPPRGNLSPSDLKKAAEKAGSDGLKALKDFDASIKAKTAPLRNTVNNSGLGKAVKSGSTALGKLGSDLARSRAGRLAGRAGKILGPLADAAQLGETAGNLIFGSDLDRAMSEQEKYKEGVENALVTIMTRQNKMKAMLQAVLNSNAALMASHQQLTQIVGFMAESIDTIEDYSGATQKKLSQVNFAAIKNSADEAARIAQQNQTKLGAANFTLQNQAAQLAKTKLEIIDATQLMATSRLAEKKWNILDATQLMATSRLAEKKWNILDATQLMATSRLAEKKWDILDATQLMATSRLAEKKWNILDATQLMGTSRMAETKWGILDVTQLMRYSRASEADLPVAKAQLTRIESKIAQPVNLSPVLSAINAIPSKFPASPNISGLTSQVSSLSTQISGINGAIAALPTRIPAPPAPNLSPILNAIANIRIPTPAAPDLSILTNQLNGLSTQITGVNGAINSIPSKIPTPTPTDLRPVLNAIAAIPGLIPTPAPTDLRPVLNAIDAIPGKIKVPEPNLTPVLRALDPIASNAADISAALSAPLFKVGMPIKAHDELLKLGQQTDSGINPTIVKSLPAMFMALSAVAYTRSGHHRLGGTFDKSVMNPTQGKVKITDMVGLQKWTFDQIDQRLGLPTAHTVIDASGRTQTKSFQSIQDAIEESNALNIVAGQDLEVVERYLFALTQDQQKLMQIALQTREDVDLLIDDSGAKFREVKRSHPTHISLKSPNQQGSLESLFRRGEVHYVARKWDDNADKNQKLEAIGYDTQIAAMSNKFELPKTNPALPLDKSRATAKTQNDEVWRTFVSTMVEPPEGYISKGNPTPDIKEIRNGTPTTVSKPTTPTKKLGK